MSGDNRSVSTDALETLGTIIGDGAGRDAIHIAVEPCIAAELLVAADHVYLDGGKAWLVDDSCPGRGIGIVDPFLAVRCQPGERFWLLVYPRTITSLRHVWAHPAFADAEPAKSDCPDKAVSEKWLREVCERVADEELYDQIVKAVANKGTYLEDGYFGASVDHGTITVRGRDAYGEIPQGFWYHLGVVTGKDFSEVGGYFSCSC